MIETRKGSLRSSGPLAEAANTFPVSRGKHRFNRSVQSCVGRLVLETAAWFAMHRLGEADGYRQRVIYDLAHLFMPVELTSLAGAG
jgi:hypothetical protein